MISAVNIRSLGCRPWSKKALAWPQRSCSLTIWKCGRKPLHFEGTMFDPMREYLTIPTHVDVVRAQEIITATEADWELLPEWARDCYERGQMVVAETGVTIFNGPKPLRARPDDFIVRDQAGSFSVYDAASFEQTFIAAHPTNFTNCTPRRSVRTAMQLNETRCLIGSY